MILSITNFKARLIAIPQIDNEDYGSFTLNKRYRVYSIHTQPEYTDFLVADDTGVFMWISSAIFRA